MNKITTPILASLALAATVQAGDDYSAKGPAPIPAPAPCLWTWFAGGSGGYIDDVDNDMWTLHLGREYKCPDSDSSHAIFLEVGWTDWDDSDTYSNDYYSDDYYNSRNKLDLDYSIVPITINYKYERPLTQRLNWYIGGGLGVAISDVEVKWMGEKYDDDETAFYGHLFAGLVWNISDAFEIFGGARYIYMDSGLEYDDGEEIPGLLDEDIFYELGARFNF